MDTRNLKIKLIEQRQKVLTWGPFQIYKDEAVSSFSSHLGHALSQIVHNPTSSQIRMKN